MKSISYHSFADENHHTVLACNRASEKFPLTVNCAGATANQWPFQTDNKKGRHDYYLFYIKTGSLRIVLPGKEALLSQGSFAIIPPECPYFYDHSDDSELIYYWVHFTGSYVLPLLKNFHIPELPFFGDLPESLAAVEYQMQKMFDCYIRNEAFRPEELAHCLHALLLELAKSLSDPADTSKKLSKSIKYIHGNYTGDLKIPELAAMEFLSVSRYITLFKKITGMPPNQYIIRLRLNNACEMLANTRLSVTQISGLLGFQNCFFFSKLFKKHLGKSPLEYRKANQ